MKQFKPFKLTFSYALKKAYNYWKRGVLQVQQGEIGELFNEEYGRCAIGCSFPMSILKLARQKGVATPVDLKRKGIIKATTKDIIRMTKMMEAHDNGKDSMRDFFVKNKMLRK